jgi:hypothetical protein
LWKGRRISFHLFVNRRIQRGRADQPLQQSISDDSGGHTLSSCKRHSPIGLLPAWMSSAERRSGPPGAPRTLLDNRRQGDGERSLEPAIGGRQNSICTSALAAVAPIMPPAGTVSLRRRYDVPVAGSWTGLHDVRDRLSDGVDDVPSEACGSGLPMMAPAAGS